MSVWPLKFRELATGDLLFADDAGGFFNLTKGFWNGTLATS